MLSHTEGSFVNGLQSVYPHVNFEKDKFIYSSDTYRMFLSLSSISFLLFFSFLNNVFFLKKNEGHWKQKENRKKFFDSFAEEHGMDPLNPESWYHVTRALIKKKKVLN